MLKKNVLTGFSGFAVAILLVICGLSFRASSSEIKNIDQLNAKAYCGCAICSCSSDCMSSSTGNIYPGSIYECN